MIYNIQIATCVNVARNTSVIAQICQNYFLKHFCLNHVAYNYLQQFKEERLINNWKPSLKKIYHND